MERQQEYYSLEEITSQDCAFVLDTTSFHAIRCDPQPLEKIEALLELQMNPSLKVSHAAGLPGDLALEIKHLKGLVRKLRRSSNYFLPKEVIAELRDYFLLADKSAGNLVSLNIEAPLVESFLSSIATATRSAYIHCVPKSERFIKENKELFNDYYTWADNFSSARENSSAKKMSVTDKRILSLALCAAWTKPTVLLTGDVNHIGSSARAILDPYRTHPVSPLYKLEVYASFANGWALWAASDFCKR